MAIGEGSAPNVVGVAEDQMEANNVVELARDREEDWRQARRRPARTAPSSRPSEMGRRPEKPLSAVEAGIAAEIAREAGSTGYF